MGASSGFWPKGSEESHVLIRMPSGLGAQRPDRSGACADVWGCLDFAASGRAEVCADSTGEKTSTATRAFVKRTKRVRILQLLDSDSIPRRSVFGSAGACPEYCRRIPPAPCSY